MTKELENLIITEYSINKKSSTKIAKQFNISCSTVCNILRKNNISKNSRIKIDLTYEQSIISDYLNGLTGEELSKKYNIKRQTIYSLLKRNKIELNRVEKRAKKLSSLKEKECKKCHKILPIDSFNIRHGRKNGHHSYCKKCDVKCRQEKRNENPEIYKKFRKNENEWRKNRAKENIHFKLRTRLSSNFHRFFKTGKTDQTTLNLLGCSLIFFKTYLEGLFQPGMNWENYGQKGWHIDHIIPCSSFDLSILEEQKICFNYSNLQPLWANQNLTKSNKIVIDYII